MKQIQIFITIAAWYAVLSCSKLDVGPSYQESDLTFWNNPASASNALNACYAGMYPSEYFFFNEDLSDNAFCVSAVNGGQVRNIAQGNYDGTTTRVAGEWAFHFGGIRTCNNLLANIDKVPGVSAEQKSRMMAEARFIRAFHYFQLFTWYGDVPLITSEIGLSESYTIPRTPKTQVVEFVMNELDDIQSILPVNTAYPASDRGRITKGAAIALKARIQLYEGNWENVIGNCELLMNSNAHGTYALFPDYGGIFTAANEYNSEVILDLQYIPVNRTHSEQRFFIPRTEGQLICGIAPSQELVDSYIMLNGKAIDEAGSGYDEDNPYTGRDPRLDATIVYHGSSFTGKNGTTYVVNTLPGTGDNSIDHADATTTGYYVRKYYDRTADAANNSGLNLILIRYADVLLMYAEAVNELGNMNADIWNKTIRQLRTRAGFTAAGALDFPALSQASLREIIRRERRSELAMEGTRIFDIRRWRTAETVLNGTMHGFKVNGAYLEVDRRVFDASKHYLWPVPQTEVNLNKNIKQNPNW
jgi:SusD family.